MLVHRFNDLIDFSFTSDDFFLEERKEGASLSTLQQEDSCIFVGNLIFSLKEKELPITQVFED